MNQALEMARVAYQALDEKKGEDIRVIDISGISAVSYTHLDVYKRQGMYELYQSELWTAKTETYG